MRKKGCHCVKKWRTGRKMCIRDSCKEDQEKYDDAIKVMRDHIAAYKGAIIEAKIEVAKNMLMENEPIDKIARYTGLAKEDILKLN